MNKILLILFILFCPYFIVCFLTWDFPWFGKWGTIERGIYLAFQLSFLPLLGLWEEI